MDNLSKILELSKANTNSPILLVGDTILDKYVSGVVNRVSPESPIPILVEETVNFVLGGAANVAINLRNLGLDVTFLTRLGKDEFSNYAKRELEAHGVSVIAYSQNYPVSMKTRYIARGSQLLRVDKEILESNTVQDLISFRREIQSLRVHAFRAVLISDYSKGVIDGESWKMITDAFAGIEIIVDPKKKNLKFYSGATMMKPNAKEAEDFLELYGFSKSLDVQSLTLMSSETRIHKIALTLGSDGVMFLDSTNDLHGNFKPATEKLVDVTGAGDAFISVLTLCAISNYHFGEACEMASQAATWTCGFLGTKPLDLVEIENDERQELFGVSTKSKTSQFLFERLRENKKVVFTNGCFDVLHSGHVELLEFAKNCGDILVVGVNSDESVKKLKGVNRPINKLEDRIRVLAAINFVDFVFVFTEETPISMIESISPDILIKGGEYDLETIVGYDYVMSKGGDVLTIPMKVGVSSTTIIDKLALKKVE